MRPTAPIDTAPLVAAHVRPCLEFLHVRHMFSAICGSDPERDTWTDSAHAEAPGELLLHNAPPRANSDPLSLLGGLAAMELRLAREAGRATPQRPVDLFYVRHYADHVAGPGVLRHAPEGRAARDDTDPLVRGDHARLRALNAAVVDGASAYLTAESRGLLTATSLTPGRLAEIEAEARRRVTQSTLRAEAAHLAGEDVLVSRPDIAARIAATQARRDAEHAGRVALARALDDDTIMLMDEMDVVPDDPSADDVPDPALAPLDVSWDALPPAAQAYYAEDALRIANEEGAPAWFLANGSAMVASIQRHVLRPRVPVTAAHRRAPSR